MFFERHVRQRPSSCMVSRAATQSGYLCNERRAPIVVNKPRQKR